MRKNATKTVRILAIAAVLLLAAVLFVGAAAGANIVPYLNSTGEMQMCPSAIEVSASNTEVRWTEGWYYVVAGTSEAPNNVVINGSITSPSDNAGDVHLILGDNSSLTVNDRIYINGNISIYSQSLEAAMGSLTVKAASSSYPFSGIWSGNNVIINGGGIKATGGTGGSGIDGDNSITINNGRVTATGGNCGISSNNNAASTNQRSGTITINGGTVIAMGNSGVESGTNTNAGSVIINGGVATFTGTAGDGIDSNNVEIRGGAVISNGADKGIESKTVTISGGTVTAMSERDDAFDNYGIYGSESVTISGGTVTAKATTTAEVTTSQDRNDGIYGGNSVTISGGTVEAFGTVIGISGGNSITISGGTIASSGDDTSYSASIWGNSVSITDAFIILNKKIGHTLTETSGVIFKNNNEGYVVGSPKLGTSATIPIGYTLKVPKDSTLTIDNNIVLTNNGTIFNNGTIDGAGTLDITYGSIDNTAGTPETTDDGKVTANVIGIKIKQVDVSSVTVDDGQTATFKAAIDSNYKPFPTDTAATTYQWQVNKGSTWENVIDGTTASYTTEATNMNMDGWKYQCIVTLDTKDTTSNAATLDVFSTDTSIRHIKVHGLAGIIDDATSTVSVALHHDMSLPTTENAFDINLKSEKAEYALTKTEADGSQWTLTVTAEAGNTQDYAVTITIITTEKEENKADVQGVISHIGHHEWAVHCETANTDAEIKKWIEEQLEDVLGLEGTTATVEVDSITQADSGAGTECSFTFTVKVTKGTGDDGHTETTTATGTITLNPIQYNIEVHAIGGGTASASPTTAIANTPITLTAAANSGYTFEKWEVLEGDITIKNNGFEMPEQDVVIHAVFTPLPPAKDDSPSSSQGMSIWLTETPTSTTTPTETPTPTVPTDIPTTQPTETPDEPGIPLAGIIAGGAAILLVLIIGAVFFFRRH